MKKPSTSKPASPISRRVTVGKKSIEEMFAELAPAESTLHAIPDGAMCAKQLGKIWGVHSDTAHRVAATRVEEGRLVYCGRFRKPGHSRGSSYWKLP